MIDPFVLECTGLPAGVRVVAFDGTEEISTTYRYEIDLLVDADADLGDAIGASATLTMQGIEGPAVHGIIATASVIEQMDGQDLHRIVLVPRVRNILGHDRHSRVFVGETVPAIIQTLLREAGLRHEDCEYRLSREYDPIDFVCQYRESTLEFLMRWMERDGIYFYFAHDGARERLVILDDKAQHTAAKVSAPYRRIEGLSESEGLRRFRTVRHAVPARVQVDDYDYLRPALPVRGEAIVQGGSQGELRVRGAKVTTPKEANRIAKLRAEGLRARQTIFHGEGRLHGLHAGELFTLSEHPRATLDGDYLVTKLHVRGHHSSALGKEMKALLGRDHEPDDLLRVELEAIWSDVQFRPELRTQVPRVHSMEGGVIEGDVDSDYAQLDEHGRYLVKFRFDERDGSGSQASSRIRMMQPHAGSPEGMHFPLRKGTEVLVAFLGGDPDRPVIAGAVPNAVTQSAVRSDNATKNVIQTGGGNRIVMEDLEGQQYIHFATPHMRTYMHMGSPFNPQYNKVAFTGGTSLSFTESISTSVTGSDAQTFVEDARITIIGRSRMSTTDQPGTEVATLMGSDFITRFEDPPPLEKLWNDVTQTKTDMTAVVTTAASALKAAWKAAPTTAHPTISQSAITVLQQALVALTGALDVVAGDLQALPGEIPASVDPTTKTTLGTDIDAAWGLISGFQSTLGALITSNPFPADDTGGGLTAALGAVTDGLQLRTNPTTGLVPSIGLFTGQQVPWTTTGVPPGYPPTPTTPPPAVTSDSQACAAISQILKDLPRSDASMPVAPSPDITASFIKLPHHGANVDQPPASTDPNGPPAPAGVTVETTDTTALDVLDTTAYAGVLAGPPRGSVPTPETDTSPTGLLRPTGQAYPFNPGSDVKIVGGDNVTLAKKDARSHTLGHSYGLVQAGQTAVVYAPSKYPAAAAWWDQDGPTKLANFNAAETHLREAKAAVAAFEKAHPELKQLETLRAAAARPGPEHNRAVEALNAFLSGHPHIESTEMQLQGLQSAVGVAQGIRDAAFNALQPLLPGNLSRPTPLIPVTWALADVAQVSTAYGNTRSWVDGSVDQTITGDKTALVNGTVRTVIHGDQHTTLADGTNSVTSEVHGTVNSYVLGSRSTEIIGSDAGLFVGSKASLTVGANTAVVLGIKTAFTLGLKMDFVIAGKINVSVGPTIYTSPTKVETALMHVMQKVLNVGTVDVTAMTGELNAIAAELHVKL